MKKKIACLIFLICSLSVFIYGAFFEKTPVYSFADESSAELSQGELLERSSYEGIALISGRLYDFETNPIVATGRPVMADNLNKPIESEFKRVKDCKT